MRRLGDLETRIMDRLWSTDEALSVRQVLEDLQRERVLAYTTVMTVLDNLHRKGFVTREKAGRAFRYTPTRSREQHTATVMNEALATSGDRRDAALLHFVEQMPAGDVARLRAALNGITDPPGSRPR